MAIQTFDVKLVGQGQLHVPSIKLAGMSINIRSNDGGITWENSNVQVNVDNTLKIYMSCRAVSGTEWEFSITNTQGKNIYDKKGQTGDTSVNKSILKTTINIS